MFPGCELLAFGGEEAREDIRRRLCVNTLRFMPDTSEHTPPLSGGGDPTGVDKQALGWRGFGVTGATYRSVPNAQLQSSHCNCCLQPRRHDTAQVHTSKYQACKTNRPCTPESRLRRSCITDWPADPCEQEWSNPVLRRHPHAASAPCLLPTPSITRRRLQMLAGAPEPSSKRESG